MKKQVIRLPLRGLMDVNCYFYFDADSGHGFLIDPGAQGEKIAEWIQENRYTAEKILLTHGHFDHIGGLEYLTEKMNIPVWIHQNGEAYLTDPVMNLSAAFRRRVVFHGAHLFGDGAVFAPDAAPEMKLRVIHTPGHTQDSVIFYDEEMGAAFSGDTIFQGNRGNDTFPGGNGEQLVESIRSRILTLPEGTVLLPGHGDATTVGDEKQYY